MVTKQANGQRLSITPNGFRHGRKSKNLWPASGGGFIFNLARGDYSVQMVWTLKNSNTYAYHSLYGGAAEMSNIGGRLNTSAPQPDGSSVGGRLYNKVVRPATHDKIP